MDALAAVRSGGLSTTGARLSQAQARFDTAVSATVAAITPSAEATTDPGLHQAIGDLAQERLLNQVLIGAFKAQDRQQEALLAIVP
jgi:hypothetical protein